MKDKACKICRREREKLLLKSDRCFSPKCAMVKRPYGPGQHGQGFKGKQTEYGKQLREKQKVKAVYGIMERQLVNYYKAADKSQGNTTEILITSLERRCDNVIYRSGLAKTRREARQIISHGKFTLNGLKITIPSILVKEGDKLSFTSIKTDKTQTTKIPTWMEINPKNGEISIKRLPLREEIDLPANENLVVEFYSR